MVAFDGKHHDLVDIECFNKVEEGDGKIVSAERFQAGFNILGKNRHSLEDSMSS